MAGQDLNSTIKFRRPHHYINIQVKVLGLFMELPELTYK